MNKREIVLLDLIKKSLFGADVSFPDDTDWKEVQKEAAAQTVLALAAASVPKIEYEKWLAPAAQSTAHYMRVLFEQTNLINLFNANNIPLVILKGTAAAVYYPTPQLRTMGDIDFLVSPEHYRSAIKLILNNGYVEEEGEAGRHYGFQKSGIIFEVHRQYSHKGIDIEPIIIEGMKRPIVHTLNGHSFPTLPDFENGLVILEHIHHHLHRAIGIRQIIDWAMFVNRVLNDEDYKKHFLPLIESVGLVTLCETLTKMCKMYIGLPDTFTWCDGADADAATELMQIFMSKGNFGVKEIYNKERPMKGLMCEVKRNGFFKSLQEIGVANFKICRKNRFFRAFAWLMQLFRFAWRGFAALIRGENLIKDASEGKDKADFYNHIGL